MNSGPRFIVACFLLVTVFFSCSRQVSRKKKVPRIQDATVVIEWKQLATGIDYGETDAPKRSWVNDSRLSILRIDPEKVEFELLCASGLDKKPRTVTDWAKHYDLDIVFNAGMYDLEHPLMSRGYLQSGKHINNGTINPAFNSMLVFNPLDSTKRSCDIVDLVCTSWPDVKSNYTAYAQGLRMIDCNGTPMDWKKGKQYCSMLVAAKDPEGRLVLVFTRSPYSHNEMIRFLGMFPMKLTHAIYLEGGPETSLFAHVGKHRIEKVGSWVSATYETDTNNRFWALPNVIGLRIK